LSRVCFQLCRVIAPAYASQPDKLTILPPSRKERHVASFTLDLIRREAICPQIAPSVAKAMEDKQNDADLKGNGAKLALFINFGTFFDTF